MHPKFKPNGSASESAILALANSLPKSLPATYLDYVRIANGASGFVGNRYVILWAVEELVGKNKDYQVDAFAPNLFLVGSNGGGEAYAFDLEKGDGVIYQVPFIGMEPKYAEFVARSIDALVPRVNLTRKASEGIRERPDL
jgi:hypothetical protein